MNDTLCLVSVLPQQLLLLLMLWFRLMQTEAR